MIQVRQNASGFSVLLNGILLLEHTKANPCVHAGRGVETVDMYRGNFDIRDRLEERIGLGEFIIREANGVYRITLYRDKAMSMDLAISEEEGRLVVRPSLLATPVIAGTPAGPRPGTSLQGVLPSIPNRFWFRLPSEPGESVFGGGEQFSHFNLKGRRFPLWTSEQGVGRNKRTRVTWEADVADKAGGDYWWTLFPQATFVSTRH